MATKKKTEVEATEEVKEVEATEEVVEEAPKKTTKKSSKKQEEVVETAEAPVEEAKEEPKAEVEVVGSKVAEVVEEAPKSVEPAKETKTANDSYLVQVVSNSGIFTFKNPGFDQPKGRVYPKGAKLAVTEVSGNWGRVGENCWILLSGAVVKI